MNDSNQKATKIEYTLNNGSTWTTASTTEATSGSFTISNLSAGTTYSVKVRTTRKANNITYVTSALTVKTYNYPYAIQGSPLTVGNSCVIGLNNEKPKAVKVYLKIGNNTSTLYETTSTTSVTGFNSAAWKTWLYSQLPTKNPVEYYVVVVDNATGHTETRLSGAMVYINENECKPTYSADNGFSYQDTNTAVTALTGNNQIIVKGYSNLIANVSTSQKATANYSATMVDYTLQVGNQTARNDYSSDSAVRIPATGSIQGVIPNTVSGQGTINVIATDSRGLTTTSSKTATVKEYILPVITSLTATRSNNGVGEDVTLAFEGTYWKESFGSANNTIVSVTYQYKKANSDVWVNGTTTITPTLDANLNKFSGSLVIAGDNAQNKWTAADTYNLKLVVKDTLLNAVNSQISRETNINSGSPAIAIYKNNVSIGNSYDTSKNSDKLQVHGRVDIRGSVADAPLVVRGIAGSDGNGNIDDLYLQYGQNKKVVLGNAGGYNISADGGTYSGTASNATKFNNKTWAEMLKAIYPVGAIYISATNTSPATLFGGTWTQLKNRYLFATNDTSGAKGKDAVSTITGTSTQGNNGNTGGTAIGQNNLPSRTVVRTNSKSSSASPDNQYIEGWSFHCLQDSGETYGQAHTHTLNNHSHAIPYIQVYVWQRTA